MLPCWLTWDLFGWFSISTFDLSSCFCAAAAFVPTTALLLLLLVASCSIAVPLTVDPPARHFLGTTWTSLNLNWCWPQHLQIVSFQGSIPASNLAIWENFLQIWARYVRTKASARLMNIKGVPIHCRYGSVMPMENGPFAFSSDQVYNH